MDYTIINDNRQAQAAMPNADFLDWANAVTGDTHDISIRDLQFYADTSGLTEALMTTAESTDAAARVVAKTVLGIFTSRYQVIDLCLPQTQRIISGLLAANLVTPAQLEDIKGLAPRITIRRCTPWGFAEITPDQLASAAKTPTIKALMQEANLRFNQALLKLQQNWDDPAAELPSNLDEIL